MVNLIVHAFHYPSEPTPVEIDGKPISECIDNILEAFLKYGSRQLQVDLVRWSTEIRALPGLSYNEAMERGNPKARKLTVDEAVLQL